MRLLDLEGTFNFRDLGGYATDDGRCTRWQTLYRADALHRLSDAAQQRLIQAGLRTIVDLRRESECVDAPCALIERDGVRYLNVPLFQDPGRPEPGRPVPRLEDVFRGIVDQRQAELGRILSLLAEPGALPAIINCTAGKDRTGVVVALVLRLVGVPPATIARDFALSEERVLGSHLPALLHARLVAAGRDPSGLAQLMSSPPEFMLHLLDYIDHTYSGARALAHRAGVTDQQIDALREALLE